MSFTTSHDSQGLPFAHTPGRLSAATAFGLQPEKKKKKRASAVPSRDLPNGGIGLSDWHRTSPTDFDARGFGRDAGIASSAEARELLDARKGDTNVPTDSGFAWPMNKLKYFEGFVDQISESGPLGTASVSNTATAKA